jgi:beta-glucosidase
VQSKTLKVDFSKFEKNVLDEIRSADKNISLISVLFSGRPLLIDTILSESSAFISSWLPGTSGGQGVVDSITGDYIFRANGGSDRRNTLSMDWPKTMVILM